MSSSVATVTYVRLNATTVKATMTLVETLQPPTLTASPSAASWSDANNANAPIVVFDVSSSMSTDRRFERCRDLVESMIGRCGPVHLITYNGSAEDVDEVAHFPATLRPNGQTSFAAAYDVLLQVLYKRHVKLGDAHRGGVNTIVFMTDGQDTSSRDVDKDLAKFKSNLSKFCSEQRVAYVVHAVGVDAAEADAKLLVKLAVAGTVEGTFGVFPSSKLPHAEHSAEYDRLVDLVAGASSSKLFEFRGVQYALTEKCPTTYTFFADSDMDCPRGTLDDEIDYFTHRLNAITSDMSKANVKTVVALRDDMQAVFIAAGKPPTPAPIRKAVRQRLEPLNELVRRIYEALHTKGPGGTFSNAAIAELNVAARQARDKSKMRFLKTAVDRSDKNAALLAEEDEAIAVLVQKSLPMTLEESATLKAMACTLTHSDGAELIADGDCLGIGIRALADVVCIEDPTRLVIEGIGACYFSANEFLSTSTHFLAGLSFDQPTSVIRDASGMHISGVLPLYINEAHWRIAKLHVRRMAAHLCCKDPLMGTARITLYSYLMTYLYLQRYAQANPGVAVEHMLGLLKRTLLMVYADHHALLPRPENFLTKAGSRVSSVVLSPFVLLDSYRALDLPFDEPACRLYATEEVLRRQFKKREPLAIDAFFKFKPSELVDPFVRQQVKDTKGQVSPVAARMAAMIEMVEKSYAAEVVQLLHLAFGKIVRGEYEADENGEMIDCGDAYDPLDKFEPVALIDERMMDVVVPPLFRTLSPDRLALVLLQASRRSGEEEYIRQYEDWFTASDDLVRREFAALCVNHIKSERVAAIGRLVSSRRDDADSAIVNYLAANDVSLLERVAMMHGICYVGRNVTNFSTTVRTYEEQRMLCQGYYDIAPLIGYKGGSVNVRTLMDKDHMFWSPKSSNLHRMVAAINRAKGLDN
jgi:hypothetical protein